MMSDHRERVNALTDSVCRSRMYEAANKYKDSVATFPEQYRDPDRPHDASHAYHDFLYGWRSAMEVTHAELLEENHELHSMLMDLCTRLMLKRCEKCKGNRINDCEACDGEGYIRTPEGEAEAVINEVVSKRIKDHSLNRAGQSLSEMELSPEEAAVIDDALADGTAKMPTFPPREDV